MDLELIAPFDADAYAGATPLFLCREGVDGDDLPESLKALAALNGFKGDIGGVLAGPEGVLVGLGSGEDPFALAAASEKLPEGDYRVEGAASEKDLYAWLLGAYRFDRYKSTPARGARLIAPEGLDIDAPRREAAGVALARDLVNTPAGDMLPDALEAATRVLAEEFNADFASIEGDALLSQNFPMIHAVGRASSVAPRLLDLTWGPADAPKVTIVGKGVCFDSGGLNLKPGNSMALMKKDMGGAANALGLARIIMAAGLNLRLRVLIPAVENAVSGDAFRPGDILPTRQGLSVEIGNTDAEGRLVLSDAMTYGGEEKPEVMITLATLTGAARVALGPDLPPFYCDDEAFAGALLAASQTADDPVWRMPLWPAYHKMLASPVADLNNAPSGGFAGSITAALFLQRFQPEGTVWGHFDIYAWRPKPAPGRPVGGEAQAIRALFSAFAARYGVA